MQTGNPTLDSVSAWLTNGGSLQSPGAAFAIGGLIKLVLVPILASTFKRFNVEFSGPNKLQAVFGVSIAIIMLVNWFTKTGLSFGDSVTLGMQVGLVAIGIHESSSTLTKASQVKADFDQVRDALAGPDVPEN